MITAIGEATMQQFVRSNYASGTYDKDLEGKKTETIKKQEIRFRWKIPVF